MSKKTAAEPPIRFAALIRVSTEQQKTKGQSLKSQKSDIASDMERLNGEIVKWYGENESEHATPGYETKELDKLLADADAGLFDAVIIAYADRWSRGNKKADEGLDLFSRIGVRFFVRGFEYDLFNPEHRLLLGVSSVVGRLSSGQPEQEVPDQSNRDCKDQQACLREKAVRPNL